MNILIRCDSSNIIGIGHVMRCLNLTQYHPENAYTFVCKNFNMNITDKIKLAGHKLILVDYELEPEINNYNTWLGHTIEQEIETIYKILSNDEYDQIIIDHYGYNHQIEEKINGSVNKITVITDIFDKNHWCDEMINYNTDDYEKLKAINLKPNTVIKCGIVNIIINKKFTQNKKKVFNDKIKKVCIMLGGSDPLNYTLEIIKIINHLVIDNNLTVFIIIGKSNNNFESINDYIKDNVNYKCLYDLTYDDLIKLYMDIDLCIGSLSVTAYERYFMNVPQICLKIVDNQNIQQLKEFNICSLNNLNQNLLNFLS